MTTNKASLELISYLSYHPEDMSSLPSIDPRPSIHPSGLLQWHAEQYDEGLVEAIDETRASWWGRRVTDQSIDELKRHRPCARYPQDCGDGCPYMKSRGRTACGWKAGA